LEEPDLARREAQRLALVEAAGAVDFRHARERDARSD